MIRISSQFMVLLVSLVLAVPSVAQERTIIMIDPGHGGEEIGVEHDGILEKDLVLRLGFIIAEEFVSRGYDVRLTRTGDYAVPWAERRTQAEEAGAAMMFMLHFNGSDDASLRGAEIRVYQADTNSARLASIAQGELEKLDTPAVTVNRDWPFLQSATVATIMIEPAYMTNPVDGERAGSVEFYRAVAQRVADVADVFLEGS